MEIKKVMRTLRNRLSSVSPLFDSIRKFCFSLGDIVEDVRMHRVVFCKSMTWFVDVEPVIEGVIIKIQKNRKEPIQVIQVKKRPKNFRV